MAEALSLESIREVLRTEIQGAVTGVNDRVAALETSLQSHNERIFQAVEALSAGQAEQGLQISQLATDNKAMAARLTKGRLSPSSPPAARPPPWHHGMQAVSQLSFWKKPMSWPATSQLQLNMADAFVPHVRRGFVLVPIAPMTGETDEAMRQRVQTCIRRVNAANINLGRKPDVNQAKFVVNG